MTLQVNREGWGVVGASQRHRRNAKANRSVVGAAREQAGWKVVRYQLIGCSVAVTRQRDEPERGGGGVDP